MALVRILDPSELMSNKNPTCINPPRPLFRRQPLIASATFDDPTENITRSRNIQAPVIVRSQDEPVGFLANHPPCWKFVLLAVRDDIALAHLLERDWLRHQQILVMNEG